MLRSLDALSVGDALGQCFHRRDPATLGDLLRRQPPEGPWRWTDDTAMATGIVDELLAHGTVDEVRLAERFRVAFDPSRGYGPSMRTLLEAATDGADVVHRAAAYFEGQGSMGNGAVMRVAPLGAWFATEPDRIRDEARRSARATHAHDEASAGAIAIAHGAAAFARGESASALLDHVLLETPDSLVRERIEMARRRSNEPLAKLAKAVHADRDITCPATVPFALAVATRFSDDLERALWETVSVGGDRDTHAAIVGGLLGARPGNVLPAAMLERREPLLLCV